MTTTLSVTQVAVNTSVPAVLDSKKNPYFEWMTTSKERAVFMKQPFSNLAVDLTLFDGALPVAPSALAPDGHVSLMRPKRSFVVPRALATDEIPGIVAAYKTGAANAKRAGFDGVEVHGANGYLLEQFLQSRSNQRSIWRAKAG